MNLRPSHIAAALLLALPTAEAGTLTLRVTGIVTTNSLTTNPLAGQATGSTAVMTFDVDAAGTPWIGAPNNGVEHLVDPASFSIDVNGAQMGMSATGQAIRLLNDYAGADKLQLNLAGLEGGMVLSHEVGLPLAAFSSTVLGEQLGVYDAAGALSYHWSVNGGNGGGVLVVQFSQLEILVGSVGTPTCFGDGSAGLCPCGNVGPVGEGCLNSMGRGATLAGSGVDSLTANNLLLDVRGLAPGVPALLVMGQPGSGALFGDGLRCVSGASQALGVRFADAGGAAVWTLDTSAGLGVQPSDLRAFQVIYRDPAGPCSAGFNHSSALEVVFTP